MEHLDKVLGEMGQSYRKISYDKELFFKISDKIVEKQSKSNQYRFVGFIAMIFLIVGGILFANISNFQQFGPYFALYVYLFYGFALMTFIIGFMMNSQKLLVKVIGHHLMKKVNSHSCFFTEKESPFIRVKAIH